MILQHVYKPILNFIYSKITYRISDRAREIILFITFFLMFYLLFAAKYLHVMSGDARDMSIMLLMGVAILFSLDREQKILKWNLVFYIPFALMGVYMLMIALFFHSIGDSYTIFILFILFACMCLAFVWGNRGDYNRMFMIVSAAYMLFYAILLVWCLAKYGIYFGEGYSMWFNTNGFAKLTCPAVACGIHLFICVEKTAWRVIFAALAGAAGCMIFFTTCKTAQIAVIMMAAACFFLLIIKGGKVLKRFICFLLVFMLAFGACFGFLHYVTPVISGDPVESHVVVFKTSSSNPNPVDENSPYKIYEREMIEKVQSNPTLAKLDKIGTGRIHLWAMYLNRINMTGNVKTLRRVGAHNQYVEFTYKAGLPVGAAWLFILVAMFIMIVIGLVKRKGDWIYFVMLNYPTFFWFSLLETGVFPMERGFILIYYLSLLPLLIRQAQAKDTIEKTIEETTEENKSMVEEM
ncbi:MAG: hypothetical protein E7221_00510 [Clostridiales bacterium]|nr:hypothetical protein [Clostridiales bacterium]